MKVPVVCLALCIVGAASAQRSTSMLYERFPLLTGGAFSFATLDTLPDGVLFKSGDIEVSAAELDRELSRSKVDAKKQLEKNRLFLLEQIAAKRMLLQDARAAAGANQVTDISEEEQLQNFFDSIAATVSVTDEEVTLFREENKDTWAGSEGVQDKDQLREYLRELKKSAVVAEYVRTIGQRRSIVLALGWVEEQAKLALDNPVDEARASGLPTLVDFGATSCRACALMTPILESLRSRFEGELNVLFVHVQEERILASHYGIESIPQQVFFDKDGKEIARHNGFLPLEGIEMQLKGMGVE
jgi:thioredoxin 1